MAKRGFAGMTPEQRSRIASLGGKAVKPESRSFSKDNKLAISSGRKGGQSIAPANRSFSQDRELAAEAGRKGGLAKKKKRTSKMISKYAPLDRA